MALTSLCVLARNHKKAISKITVALLLFTLLVSFYDFNLSTAQTTPTPTPSAPTVKFSLWFTNGTAFPTDVTADHTYGAGNDYLDINGIPVNVDWGGGFDSAAMESGLVVLRNDGNVPIMVNATLGNVNVPSDIQLVMNWVPINPSVYSNIGNINQWMGYGNLATGSSVGVGQYVWLGLILVMMQSPTGEVTNSVNFSFDIVVTATQAS
jgi:hypothetical protein